MQRINSEKSIDQFLQNHEQVKRPGASVRRSVHRKAKADLTDLKAGATVVRYSPLTQSSDQHHLPCRRTAGFSVNRVTQQGQELVGLVPIAPTSTTDWPTAISNSEGAESQHGPGKRVHTEATTL